MNNESKLTLKPISELLAESFFIPAYQRGYRWTKRQVKELLDDIWDFRRANENGPKEAFYCLQPVVVSNNNGNWEVVDGQQRLTTIYIILSFLEKEHLRRPLAEAYKKPLFSIEYETRANSTKFLKNITGDNSKNNIDYYHISNAYHTITTWFKDKDYNEQNAFLATLLAKKGSKAVEVIWYDLSDECKDTDYAIDVFTRINIGKIPLTNAELIKALFLGKIKQDGIRDQDRANLKRLQIASEWDKIEYTLQKDDFWHFIYNGSKNYDTRIEYIFDLMKNKPKEAEPYFTFHKFNEDLQDNEIDDIWLSVKEYFQRFQDWFNNRVFYHYIGYLIATVADIAELIDESSRKTKTEFKLFLVNRIKSKMKFDVDELEYDDKNKIKPLLLLFNIQTLLDNPTSNSRFPFDLYKKENWDIEHIRSIQSEKPGGNASQKEWLTVVLQYFIGDGVQDKQAAINELNDDEEQKIAQDMWEQLQNTGRTDVDFANIYEKVLDFFNEIDEPENINSISNLTLLDSNTNRSYKNAPFPIKRQVILEKDKTGTFVPLCTKNVFLKSYSTRFDDLMYWQDDDRQKYLNAIKSTLADFIQKTEGSENAN